MNATPDVTRYVTGYVPETRVIPTDPTRPDPNLTGPTANYLWSPFTTSSRNVSAQARDEVVEQ